MPYEKRKQTHQGPKKQSFEVNSEKQGTTQTKKNSIQAQQNKHINRTSLLERKNSKQK